MLISIYFPFSDFRQLFVSNFYRLANPDWPYPEVRYSHLRGIGSIRRRRKRGFEGWVGEDRLAIGVSAIALKLPRTALNGLAKIRLVRKACFFDGLCNGRIEFIFSVDIKSYDKKTIYEIIKYLLETDVVIKQHAFSGPIYSISKHVTMVWGGATIKHGQLPHYEFIKCGRPVCVVETLDPLFSNLYSLGSTDYALNTYVSYLRNKYNFETIVISPSSCVDRFAICHVKHRSRCLRTYSFRLLQNVDMISLILRMPELRFSDESVQNVFNEYTRQIYRSEQKLDMYESKTVIDYCYSVFSRLYPGRIESVRIAIQNSGMRPNVVKKMLRLVDVSDMSAVNVIGNVHVEKIMGDKFSDIKVAGQGVAIGKSAYASVNSSANILENNASLPDALNALAAVIRHQTERSDREIEAVLIESAAAKAKAGDEKSAADLFRKTASWVLDVAKSSSSAVLSSFLNSYLGL